MPEFRVMPGHVLLDPDIEEQYLDDAGILIRPANYRPINQRCTVLAIGRPIPTVRFKQGRYIRGEKRLDPDLKVGSRVIFPWKRAKFDLGHELSFGGKTFRLFSFEQAQNLLLIEE